MKRQRCPPPTAEQLRSITAFIRSGGFPLVAAEAAGVSRERFEQWLQLGSITRGKTTPYRTFTLAVRQAVCQSPHWQMTRSPSFAYSNEAGLQHATTRLTAGFRYAGPAMERSQADRLLGR